MFGYSMAMLAQISAAAGLLGVTISMIAYMPQITHLIRERCSAGISTLAYAMWLIASVLITFHAIMISDTVFILLGLSRFWRV